MDTHTTHNGALEGLFPQWLQIRITLMRSRIRIKIRMENADPDSQLSDANPQTEIYNENLRSGNPVTPR